MTTEEVVLAKATLTESELQDFMDDFRHSSFGKFTEIQYTALEDGWTEVKVCSNGQLPDDVTKKMFRESLMKSNGEFAQCYWRKAVQIVT